MFTAAARADKEFPAAKVRVGRCVNTGAGIPLLLHLHLIVQMLGKKLEIYGSIIQLVTIDMVDILMAQKRAAQGLLHDMAVLIDVLTVNAQTSITIPTDDSSALPVIC